jgi:hypothetical protein
MKGGRKGVRKDCGQMTKRQKDRYHYTEKNSFEKNNSTDTHITCTLRTPLSPLLATARAHTQTHTHIHTHTHTLTSIIVKHFVLTHTHTHTHTHTQSHEYEE